MTARILPFVLSKVPSEDEVPVSKPKAFQRNNHPATHNPQPLSGRTGDRCLPTATPPAKLQAAATAKLTQRGYVILYRPDIVNHCPACGHTHWWIGRRSAQCAFCDTALDLAETSQ
jgi:hypothetical protein